MGFVVTCKQAKAQQLEAAVNHSNTAPSTSSTQCPRKPTRKPPVLYKPAIRLGTDPEGKYHRLAVTFYTKPTGFPGTAEVTWPGSKVKLYKSAEGDDDAAPLGSISLDSISGDVVYYAQGLAEGDEALELKLNPGGLPPEARAYNKPAKETVTVKKTVTPLITLGGKSVVQVKEGTLAVTKEPVKLSISEDFDGTGEFTVSTADIVFYRNGAKLEFDGTKNSFPGSELKAGINLEAEGAAASASTDAVLLKLELKGGSKPVDPPAEAKMTAIQVSVAWDPAEGWCGDKPKLKVTAKPVPDTTAVKVKLKKTHCKPGDLPEVNGQAASNAFEQEWEIKDIGFDKGSDFEDHEKIEAKAEVLGFTSLPAELKVKAALNAAEKAVSIDRNLGIAIAYGNKARFKIKIDKFKIKVAVEIKVLYCQGGYWVNMSKLDADWATKEFGGVVEAWKGYAFAQPSATDPQYPGKYYSGWFLGWRKIPSKYSTNDIDLAGYSLVGFYKKDGKWEATNGMGTWPGKFKDYDKATFATRVQDFVNQIHTVWRDKYIIRRKDCTSAAACRCCRYDVDVTVTLTEVAAPGAGVIPLVPGRMRANAGCFALGDLAVAPTAFDKNVWAHETGHLMDNPDEYANGAVDVSANWINAASTLDGDVINPADGTDGSHLMTDCASNIKKRHYLPFATEVADIINTAYGFAKEYTIKNK